MTMPQFDTYYIQLPHKEGDDTAPQGFTLPANGRFYYALSHDVFYFVVCDEDSSKIEVDNDSTPVQNLTPDHIYLFSDARWHAAKGVVCLSIWDQTKIGPIQTFATTAKHGHEALGFLDALREVAKLSMIERSCREGPMERKEPLSVAEAVTFLSRTKPPTPHRLPGYTDPVGLLTLTV